MIASAVESFVQVDVTVTAERVVQGNAAVVPAVPVAAAAAAAAVAVVVAAAVVAELTADHPSVSKDRHCSSPDSQSH